MNEVNTNTECFNLYNEAIDHLGQLTSDQRVSKYFYGYRELLNKPSPTDIGDPSLLYVCLNNKKKILYIVTKNERDENASLIEYSMESKRLRRICDCMKPIFRTGQLHSYLCQDPIRNQMFRTHGTSDIGQIQFRTFDHDTEELEVQNTIKTNWTDGSLVLKRDNNTNAINNLEIVYEHYRHIKDSDKAIPTTMESRFPIEASKDLVTIDPVHIFKTTKRANIS